MKRLFVVLACLLSVSGWAAESDTAEAPVAFQAGYGDMSDFGGPEGVSDQLMSADRARESTYQWETPQRWFKPWYDWKGKLKSDHGLAMGFFFGFLGQTASDTTTGDDDALGNILRFQGSWALVNRGKQDRGRIEWRVEYRDRMLGQQAPMELSAAVGAAAALTRFSSSSFNLYIPADPLRSSSLSSLI